jgi:hypothetical protein
MESELNNGLFDVMEAVTETSIYIESLKKA